ncbi:Cyclin-dependent kinase inhibitor 4 [Linum grandiflorum]
MGKYMGKTKRTGQVAGMDLSLGVRTRAKTLALLRLQQQQTTPKLHASPLSCPPPDASAAPASAGYLQLRSRRLEKPPVLLYGSNRRQSRQADVADQVAGGGNPNPNPNPVHGSESSGIQDQKWGKETIGEIRLEEELVQQLNDQGKDSNQNGDLALEASFGENCLETEGKDRSTRESTPCSLIRDPETTRTPGSTTRPTSSTNASTRMQNSSTRRIPTAREMDEFFAGAEEEQVKQFIDKYNFDPVNEKPLPPGRYEWEKIDP